MANTYRKTGEAPSGRRYVYRGLNPFQAAQVYGGIVSLADVAIDKPMDLTTQELVAAEQVCRSIVVLGTVEPRVVEKEDPEYPDAVLFDDLGADMVWLQYAILEATGLTGKASDEARRFRGKRGAVRKASRGRKGQRGAA